MNYLHWNQTTITDFSAENIAALYDKGYVFTRLGKGVMHQTRSVRIDLSRFAPTSENRRVLKKTHDLVVSVSDLPMPHYDLSIGKLAKDFYSEKFGQGIMSAQKIKEMCTDPSRGNFNRLLTFLYKGEAVGYAICYVAPAFMHYSYPFYDLGRSPNDMGLGMMIRAIQYAQEAGMRHLYLGSLQRPSDTYKLQFEGLEWFDGGPNGTGTWQTDIETVKKMLRSDSTA